MPTGAEKELTPKILPRPNSLPCRSSPRSVSTLPLQPSVVREIFASRMVFRASKNVLFLLFNSAPSAEAKVLSWFNSHPLSCEFFQASQFPLGSPTFSQSPFEVVHGASAFWREGDSVQLWTQGEADVNALTLCQLIVHHHECFHLVGQRKL